MPEPLADRWDRFLRTFFGTGNDLAWPSDNAVVRDFVEANARSVADTTSGPFVLPLVRNQRTSYIAIALDADQAHDLRHVLGGVVGATYTTFTGRPVQEDLGDQVLQSAVALAGSPAHVFSFDVVVDRAAVRAQVLLLLDLLRRRPTRGLADGRPIGRLLRDFERALADRDADGAARLLFGPIAATGRLSNQNRLFLHVRILAAFDRWDELESLPSFSDLLRLDRPALVSDALARLAVLRMAEAEGAEAFAEVIAPKFGALVPSVERIRSAAGAEYYVRWSLLQGEPVDVVARRLSGLSWAEAAPVAGLLGDASVIDQRPSPPGVVRPEEIEAAFTAGRFETVVDLLARAEPSLDLLPVMVRTVTRTISTAAIAVVGTFRQALGDEAVDAAVARLHDESGSPTVGSSPVATWTGLVEALADGRLSQADAVGAAEEMGLLELVREDDEYEAFTSSVENASGDRGPELVLEMSLDVLRRLGELLPEERRSRLGRLRLAVLRLWALTIDSGDRTTAADVLDQVEAMFDDGCSTAEYLEIVDLVTLRWEPFLSDGAFGLGVRALEMLVSARPDGVAPPDQFATRLLGRLAGASTRRLDDVDVLTAQSLSDDLGLGLTLWDDHPRQVDDDRVEWSGVVGIYSLDDPALARAAASLRRLFPAAEIRTANDRVSSGPLRSLAARADVMVVATQKATHAATDAVRTARTHGDLTYPRGKGSSSLVRAAVDAITSLVSVS